VPHCPGLPTRLDSAFPGISVSMLQPFFHSPSEAAGQAFVPLAPGPPPTHLCRERSFPLGTLPYWFAVLPSRPALRCLIERTATCDRRIPCLPRARRDRSHHHFARVHAYPNLQIGGLLGSQLPGVAFYLILHPNCRVEWTLRMILMSQRCAEQCKDPIARRLHHVSVVALGPLRSSASMPDR
jgi:hypothetical protein